MSGGAGTGKIAVRRAELATTDMGVMADLINSQYVEHKAWFRCPAPSRVDAGIRSAVAGPMEASIARYRGFDYYARASGPQDYLALVVLHGEGAFIHSREQLHFARGDVVLLPSGEPFKAEMRDFAYSLVRIPRHFLTAFAKENLGLTAGSVRIESIAPRSRSAGARWSRTAAFICEQLLDDQEGAISPILAQEVTRMAVATVLEVFPSTAMTSAYIPDPSWAPPATIRRATAFVHANAGRPVSVAEIAESAGVTPRALQYAFRRHYETTVTGYLRQVRLEQAHRELRDGDSAAGATVAAIARRWGWATPGSFASAYRRQYGVTPSLTLRT
ncbi:MAG TPA: AraC family transcriptional regulator [Trebonia sp.]|jgi:AraC-like DNA-binding protein|nr:AraC family transcriptional regulator [Trebonia sp.]